MPIQAPVWTEFLSCPICCQEFNSDQRGPISLGCGHTFCKACLGKLQKNQCPYDQNVMRVELDRLPLNSALLSLVSPASNSKDPNRSNGEALSSPPIIPSKFSPFYTSSTMYIKDMAQLLKPFSNAGNNQNGHATYALSRPVQRKLVTLINCQLADEEGRARAVRSARSLGERSVTELILHHQNHHQLSANLWAAVRSRGCQFLGPAMQEEVLKLVLLALEDGSALSRKVLVLFVVQRLEPHFPQASKTSIGHVVQLLYRASCFMVTKRDGDSSLMKLKEEFRTYDSLRHEHDAQIVQIANEAGLRIAPDQWSSLLYGDMVHKSHMQSIMDKLQTPQSFGQSVQELIIALQRTEDPGSLSSLRQPLEFLANLDPSSEGDIPDWHTTSCALESVKIVVFGLVRFIQFHGNRKLTDSYMPHGSKFKTILCRDLSQRGGCPRGNDCTFAHTEKELMKFRNRNRKHKSGTSDTPVDSGSHPPDLTGQSGYHKGVLPTRDSSPQKYAYTNAEMPSHTASTLSNIPQMHQSSISPQNTPQESVDKIPSIQEIRDGNKNDLSVMVPLIQKSLIVDPTMVPPPSPHMNPFEVRNMGPVPPHSSTFTLTPTANHGILRQTFTPQPRPPMYAAHIPDYSYQPLPPPGVMFPHPGAPNGPGPPMSPVPGGHPVITPHPQAIQAILPEAFPQAPRAMLVNSGRIYNVVNAPEYHSIDCANPRMVPFQQNPHSRYLPDFINTSASSIEEENKSSNPSFSIDKSDIDGGIKTHIDSKSLSELTERKEELICKLQDIMGEEAVSEMTTKIANGESVITASESEMKFTSTYSIWTSGADFSLITGKKSQRKFLDAVPCYSKHEESKFDEPEDFIPFDPPYTSRFGPISRNAKRPEMSMNPIQVSASNNVDSFTTPVVYHPLPAISPMPQVLYQQPGNFTTFVSYPPTLDYMNTIGHGIIDPPHLHMSQLEPFGSRPTDPVLEVTGSHQEEQQRQQLIAAKDSGEEVRSMNQKMKELELKKELDRVVLGIQEKEKQIE